MNNKNNLYQALQRLNRQMYRHAHRTLPENQRIHRGQGHLLLLIAQNDGAIQRDLSELMDVRPSSMTEMLVKLEQDELIVRKPDEKDQRVLHICLTTKGKEAIEKLAEVRNDLSSTIFNCLTDKETTQMVELAEKVSCDLEASEGAVKEPVVGRRGFHRMNEGRNINGHEQQHEKHADIDHHGEKHKDHDHQGEKHKDHDSRGKKHKDHEHNAENGTDGKKGRGNGLDGSLRGKCRQCKYVDECNHQKNQCHYEPK